MWRIVHSDALTTDTHFPALSPVSDKERSLTGPKWSPTASETDSFPGDYVWWARQHPLQMQIFAISATFLFASMNHTNKYTNISTASISEPHFDQ
jgi:hypothetical protein